MRNGPASLIPPNPTQVARTPAKPQEAPRTQTRDLARPSTADQLQTRRAEEAKRAAEAQKAVQARQAAAAQNAPQQVSNAPKPGAALGSKLDVTT
ncbi:MAG TPA: hypothetical protein VJ570_01220 [Holophagaceae bacterium]|nr:hypothetical protein [Holophagaceae bacterium]